MHFSTVPVKVCFFQLVPCAHVVVLNIKSFKSYVDLGVRDTETLIPQLNYKYFTILIGLL